MSVLPLSPTLLLGLLFCVCYAALSHLLGGRTFRELLAFLMLGTLGFGFGQLIGSVSPSPFLQIGELHLFEASVVAWVLLGVVYLVSRG